MLAVLPSCSFLWWASTVHRWGLPWKPVPRGIFCWRALCRVPSHTLTAPCLLYFVASISSRSSFFYVWPFHQTSNFVIERPSLDFPGSSAVKNLPAMWETLGWEDCLEKGMATHSGILTWRVPWTEEAGRLQSISSQRVGHDWRTNAFTSHWQV